MEHKELLHGEKDAFVVSRAGHIAVEGRPVPSPSPSEVLVEVAYAGVCHTDHYIVSGDIHRICTPSPSQHTGSAGSLTPRDAR
jgi:D-arabinose 1-dehydrogenase-like Zn-dependent alcohol dehydrogenase